MVSIKISVVLSAKKAYLTGRLIRSADPLKPFNEVVGQRNIGVETSNNNN